MRRSHKSILILSVILMAILLSSFSSLATIPKVYDEAGIFLASEMEALEEKAIDLSERLKLDIVIVTTDDNKGKTSRQYADDFYDENGFGYGIDDDGLLLLINMDDREVYISTTGLAIKYFTDDRLDSIIDEMFTHLANGNYVEAVDAFFKEVEYYFNMGIQTNQYTHDSEGDLGKRIVMYLFISLIIGGISVGVMVLNNKGKISTNEGTYLANSSINFINSQDRLINTRVTHVTIKTNTNKSTISSGKSTVHRSSSGKSHGGRGRKF
ncbi:TPM domain-containing protein [Alkaliphilus peptidifermentans]|uniref:TPM domain-containing protein n=1 Tax=Alkaliphilus peptidifermentans DSM 18978 TaxID=1120976 RepID=A0A1G5FYA3_9FIRM|nr:TPM domain-containing protein [Alkaliphilus peptidifermentans]SCY43850.1 uncharacterized protein SAMN03080606_01529 [Alkaliphilus peptidifermentans DSM 18978]